MNKELQMNLADVANLAEVQMTVLALLKATRNAEGNERLGFVSGSVFSDGPDMVQTNIRRLAAYTDKMREQHGIPIFSAVDIFYSGLFERLPESKLPYDERRALFFKFWDSVIESGHITDVFMAPNWRGSEGATKEHDGATRLGMNVHYIEVDDGILGLE